MGRDYSRFPILKYFSYAHLPKHLQVVSSPFEALAYSMVNNQMDENLDIAETIAGVRKLLEAKDCAVRAMVK